MAVLRARICVRSTPLEHTQCRDLRAGALLCVSCALDGGDLKFYDAILESVLPAAHEIVDGKERCACRLMVRWSEGPRAGSREEVGVEWVCCVQSSPVQDLELLEFLDGVTKLLDRRLRLCSCPRDGCDAPMPSRMWAAGCRVYYMGLRL